MSYPMRKEDAMSEYMNRAGRRMYRYYSDLRYDIQKIESLRKNESIFFIVTPSGTFSTYKLNLAHKRREVEQTWGNHIVIEVRRDSNYGYFVENYDKTISLRHDSWEGIPQHVIDAFNDFVLESDQI